MVDRAGSLALVAVLYRWRLVLSGVLVAGAILFLPHIDLAHVDNGVGAWFAPDDPVVRDYDRFRAEFGGTQPLIIVLAAEGTDIAPSVFTRERLESLSQISDEIERVPSVFRVQSLATTSLVRALPGDGLEVRPLLDHLDSTSPERLRELAINDPLIVDALVSRSGTLAAVVVTFDEDQLRRDRTAILDRIHQIVSARLLNGLQAYYNGSIEISEAYNRITLTNHRRFIPLVLGVIALAMYLLFRSVSRMLIVLFSILVSVLWTLGLYSMTGFGVNILTAMLAPLVVVLAISDDLHVIQQYDYHRRRTDSATAFQSTLSYVLAPLLGAGITTALGLLTLATSDIVAVREFGIGAAIGVTVDMAISIVLVPTLLGWVRPNQRLPPFELFLVGFLRRAAAVATSRSVLVTTAAAIVCVAAVAGLLRLRVETNHIGFFSASHPLSRSAAVIDRDLAGVYDFHVLLEGPPDSMKDPDVLKRIDRLSTDLHGLPDVRKVVSLASYVKRTHQTLHNGAAAAAVIPDDPLVIAQELFLFTMEDQGRAELERVATSDFSRSTIIVRLPSMGSDMVFERIQAADRLASAAFAGSPVTATVTGSGRLYSALDHHLVQSQISSFSTAFAAVFAACFVIFRSIRFGLLALVPNVLPILIVLGTMGWLEISLNVATVMVASIALGVVDDDTVHFIHRFRQLLRDGMTVDDAVGMAAVIEGRAAVTIALVASAGFAVLLFSEYKPSAWFGGLLALTMAVALLVEILVLPAVVKLLPRSFTMPSHQ